MDTSLPTPWLVALSKFDYAFQPTSSMRSTSSSDEWPSPNSPLQEWTRPKSSTISTTGCCRCRTIRRGTPSAGLKLLDRAEPDIVKIDRYFVDGLAIGAEFEGAHGVHRTEGVEAKKHEEASYRVVGLLAEPH